MTVARDKWFHTFMWGADKSSRRVFEFPWPDRPLFVAGPPVVYLINAFLTYWRCALCDRGSMDKIKVLVTGQEEKDTSSLMDDVNESCKCSRKTRLYGFVICACIGFFISFLVGLIGACCSLKSTALLGAAAYLRSLCALL